MDITTITNIWKPIYGRLVQGIRQLTPEYADLKQLRNFIQLSPRTMTWPVVLSNGGGIAFTSDGGSTARASSNEPPEATDTWTYLTGRFEVGFNALNPDRQNAAVIEPQLRFQAADKLRSFQRAVAVGFYGNPSNILFLAEGTASNPSGTETKVRVKDLYGVTGLVPSTVRSYLTANKDYVNVHSGVTSTVRGGGKLLSIDETNLDLTLATSADIHAVVAAGDAIVLNNQILAGADDDLDLGINGLLHLTRATTVHNISSATQPDWVPTVDKSAYGAALSGVDLFSWFQDIENKSGMAPTFGYTTVGVIAEAGSGELDLRRYGSDDDTMRLGFTKVQAMGLTLKGRPYCPSGYLFLGSGLRKIAPDEDPKNVVQYGDKAGGFKEYDNQLGFYKDQVMRTQMALTSRAALGVVSGVTEA